MKASAQQIFSFLDDCLPEFEPAGDPVELEGGNLNHVWRITGQDKSLIVKQAPPYIAANPDVPIDPGRLEFEAKALDLFSEDGQLTDVSSGQVRPPERLGYDGDNYMLAMEDITPSNSWFGQVKEKKSAVELAGNLGLFIGKLHAQTFRQKEITGQFRNLSVQKTRQNVQYKSVEKTLQDHGFHSSGAVENAETLGEVLLEPGVCLVMGDLWPQSVLFQDGDLRLIDWEFAHFGRPLQDVAHFAAHCFMYDARYSHKTGKVFRTVWQKFLSGYRQGTGSRFDTLWSQDELVLGNVHFGAEILIRTLGPFREGYIFQDQISGKKRFEWVVTEAVERLVYPETITENKDELLFF